MESPDPDPHPNLDPVELPDPPGEAERNNLVSDVVAELWLMAQIWLVTVIYTMTVLAVVVLYVMNALGLF